MSASDKSLYRVQLKAKLAKGSMAVAITGVINPDGTESSTAAACTDASIVFMNTRGTKMEMTIGTMAAGTLTLSKRGLENGDTIVENAANQIDWVAGTICYVTKLAFNYANDYAKKTDNNTFSGKQTFNDVDVNGVLTMKTASELDVLGQSNPRPSAASDAARNIIYPTPTEGDVCKRSDLHGIEIYDAATATWILQAAGTPTPNGSTTAAGIYQEATTAQIGAGTATGSTGARLVVNPSSTVKTSSGAGDENKIPVLDASGKLADGFMGGLSFGDGSDGDVTITTTVTMTRDMYYNNLTITSPGILIPDGYRIFVRGTLSGNGKIQRNGNDGGNASGVTKGAAATILNQGSLNAEVAPGDGGNAGQPGANATAGGAANPAYHTANGSNGGVGGVGTGAGGTGGVLGAGGISTRGSLYNIGYNPARIVYSLAGPASYQFPASTQYKSTGAAGGGGGGCTAGGGSPLGGGGGGGGGNAGFVRAAINIVNRTGTRELIGGKGGNGANGAGVGAGGGGGGGGGNGGILYLVYKTLTSIGTKTFTGGVGGTKGTGGGSGGGDGANGVNGSVGVSIEIAVN